MKNTYIYDSKIGKLNLTYEEDRILEISTKNSNYPFYESVFIKKFCIELDLYFQGKLKDFTSKYQIIASDFQKRVYEQLIKIPYGQTMTYKEIAIAIGSEKAARAVGMACNRNPLLLLIPCHRVIGSNNALVGFALGLDVKEELLELEKNNY